MNENFIKWNDFEKELNISKEQEEEIKLEMDLIQATINARKNNNFSQRDLSKLTGIKQPSIARIEKRLYSPKVNTLIKLLYPIGYTLRVVPLNKKNK